MYLLFVSQGLIDEFNFEEEIDNLNQYVSRWTMKVKL